MACWEILQRENGGDSEVGPSREERRHESSSPGVSFGRGSTDGSSGESPERPSVGPRPTETPVLLDSCRRSSRDGPSSESRTFSRCRKSQRAMRYRLSARKGGSPSRLSACIWLSKWDSFLPVSLSRILRLIAI